VIKHRYILISLVAAAAVGIAFVLWRGSDEPRHQGKTMKEWLSSIKNGHSVSAKPEVLLMLEVLGSNAVPPLVRILDQDKTPIRDWFATKTLRMPWAPDFVKSSAANHLRNAQTLPFHAELALERLGKNAVSAIPDLERIICDPEKERGWLHAAASLSRLSPAALPALRRSLTNAPSSRRPVLSQLAIPALEISLQSRDSRAREESALTASDFPKPPFEMIPILVDLVEGNDKERREHALRALGKWIPEIAPTFMPAREAIEKAARSDDSDTRRLANEVLAKLPDPKAP
jgi:hypothetical protein